MWLKVLHSGWCGVVWCVGDSGGLLEMASRWWSGTDERPPYRQLSNLPVCLAGAC